MSKITRRDFLKTAGVMTLAVAAAGVLAGCDGAEKPVAPETGNKALGDITKIGKMEFSVVKAVQQNNITTTLDDAGTGVKETLEKASLCVLMSVRNTADVEGEKGFDFNKVKLYVNGQKVTTNTREYTSIPKSVKEYYGEDVKSFKAATGMVELAPEKNATYYEFFAMLDKDVYGDLKDVNTVEVTYYDAADKTAVNYTIPTPLTVVKKVNGK